MSSSEPADPTERGFALFQFRPLKGEEGKSLPEPGTFVLQNFDRPTRKVSYSDQELVAMAEQMLAAAKERCQLMERQAYEEGFVQGQKDGQEVGRRGMEEVVQRLEKMLAALGEETKAVYRRRERDLVELALLVSQKIVGRELTMQPEAVRTLIETGFRCLQEAEQLKLRVHPQDFALLTQYSPHSRAPGVELVADSSIIPGGFILESDRGEVDGTLETRWEKVSQALRRVMEKSDE
jgi:flagellar assembly protein FliH|uniref:Flagellar assembly protein FliH n=1 Tax=Desulfobacca acetoxidans TaxID=60893 RepID=A0A7C3SK74_9BACT